MKTTKALSALGSALALSVALPASALSATDTTAPTLRTPIKSSFLVGSQVSPDYDCSTTMSYLDLDETTKWSGSDDSGAVSYTVEQNFVGSEPYFLLEDSRLTSVQSQGSTYDGNCGGSGFSPSGITVYAQDPAGNTTDRFVAGGVVGVTQDDGTTTTRYARLAKLSFSPDWARSSCVCWSHSTTRKTTTAGAAATATLTVPPGEASHLGLVMAEGPGRGKFRVYVDGVRHATVGTYAATSRPRVIVWQVALRAGTHKVRIVNLATPGRPRIDLDAVLTN